MSVVQNILKEINLLNMSELRVILNNVKERISSKEKLEKALGNFVGKGHNLWEEDAQTHINDLREEE